MKQKGRLLFAVFFAFTVMTAALALQKTQTVAFETDSAQAELRLLALHNAHRANAGLAPLQATDALMQAAKVRAGEITSCFSHVRPDGSAWWTVSPDYAYGENLAYGYVSADNAMNAWMCSPEHMYNVMNPSYATIGVGAVMVGGTWYYVTEFGY